MRDAAAQFGELREAAPGHATARHPQSQSSYMLKAEIDVKVSHKRATHATGTLTTEAPPSSSSLSERSTHEPENDFHDASDTFAPTTAQPEDSAVPSSSSTSERRTDEPEDDFHDASATFAPTTTQPEDEFHDASDTLPPSTSEAHAHASESTTAAAADGDSEEQGESTTTEAYVHADESTTAAEAERDVRELSESTTVKAERDAEEGGGSTSAEAHTDESGESTTASAGDVDVEESGGSTTAEKAHTDESGESTTASAGDVDVEESGGSTTAEKAPAQLSPNATGAEQVQLPQLVDCVIEGGSVPVAVLGKLRKCTDALDEFARAVKNQHGRSRDTNQHYVKTFKHVMKQLQSIRDVDELNKAFSKDQDDALQVLMSEANKAKADIESLLPARHRHAAE